MISNSLCSNVLSISVIAGIDHDPISHHAGEDAMARIIEGLLEDARSCFSTLSVRFQQALLPITIQSPNLLRNREHRGLVT